MSSKMADSISSETELFESLRKQVDPTILEEQTRKLVDREIIQNVKAQEQLKELININSTFPIKISSVQVIGAKNTRRSFLEKLLNPLTSDKTNKYLTLSEALHEVRAVVDKLSRFGIYHPNIQTFIDRHDIPDSSLKSTPIDIYLKAQECGRISLKTGTDLGNAEGSAYGNLTWRNIFGGAESLNLNASAGTRTRSAYQATFDSPLLSDPEKRIQLEVHASSILKPWASHEEVNRGVGARYNWVSKNGGRHQVGYNGLWRQITGLATEASSTIRNEAGDSVKSSLTHTWLADHRDHPLLPTRGYFLKSFSEIAGWGPLQGDVAFFKSEIESAHAFPVRIPGLKGDSGVSITNSLRAGILHPLPIGFGKKLVPSQVTDRFQLGGPTDVRGFKTSGLGPRDGHDGVGGDVYAAACTNLLLPLPRTGKDAPIRLQIFANAGRLLALSGELGKHRRDTSNSQNTILATIAELGDGLPSLAAGFGIVYAHPVARFELNFCLPFVIRKGEEGRKGLQFGVGINFL
ncbi:SAM50-like protein SPAC17C9.06 [Golovinomyces cichoracearum]|uniref:SAM50-like protein SPAC17C9.06 n=1 Tax=Golovinomyces cichoracearum TaxID=62708 RepID=A0A420IZ29_9PEZI|nr:SAM50-like protein SPAC17C9.06 [Golovinomyces cichoracearum]